MGVEESYEKQHQYFYDAANNDYQVHTIITDEWGNRRVNIVHHGPVKPANFPKSGLVGGFPGYMASQRGNPTSTIRKTVQTVRPVQNTGVYEVPSTAPAHYMKSQIGAFQKTNKPTNTNADTSNDEEIARKLQEQYDAEDRGLLSLKPRETVTTTTEEVTYHPSQVIYTSQLPIQPLPPMIGVPAGGYVPPVVPSFTSATYLPPVQPITVPPMITPSTTTIIPQFPVSSASLSTSAIPTTPLASAIPSTLPSYPSLYPSVAPSTTLPPLSPQPFPPVGSIFPSQPYTQPKSPLDPPSLLDRSHFEKLQQELERDKLEFKKRQEAERYERELMEREKQVLYQQSLLQEQAERNKPKIEVPIQYPPQPTYLPTTISSPPKPVPAQQESLLPQRIVTIKNQPTPEVETTTTSEIDRRFNLSAFSTPSVKGFDAFDEL